MEQNRHDLHTTNDFNESSELKSIHDLLKDYMFQRKVPANALKLAVFNLIDEIWDKTPDKAYRGDPVEEIILKKKIKRVRSPAYTPKYNEIGYNQKPRKLNHQKS